MNLTRTSYGLSNEHLFYDVSLVVYCEGREGGGSTHDEMFWGKIFSSFGVSCVCKSRGSKTSIVPLAIQAIRDGVENIAFAMDRDYGGYHGFPVENRIVIYTYGYSWENDVLIGLDATAILSMFAPVVNGDRVNEDLAAFVANASDTASRVAHMDIRNALTTKALFDREKPVSIFVGEGQSLRFDELSIAKEFSQISLTEEMASIQEMQHDWLRVFYGKACARMIYQWFVDRSQQYSNRSKIPYDAFLRLCISTMVLRPEEYPRDQYYKEALSALSV